MDKLTVLFNASTTNAIVQELVNHPGYSGDSFMSTCPTPVLTNIGSLRLISPWKLTIT